MLRSLKDLERYTVAASDGDIGTVMNFLVDETHWAVRYLDVETGSFFADRHVLVSPLSFRQTDWATRCFHVQLTMDKVRQGPGTDTLQPVSRQQEMTLSRYYEYPHYWASGEGSSGETKPDLESHLLGANDLHGYHVEGSDGAIGHVQDFIVDDQTWAVRYLVIDTSAWWFGKRVLIAPQWATSIDVPARSVRIRKRREEVRNGPAWDPSGGIDREYEVRLHDYWGVPPYWSPSTP